MGKGIRENTYWSFEDREGGRTESLKDMIVFGGQRKY